MRHRMNIMQACADVREAQDEIQKLSERYDAGEIHLYPIINEWRHKKSAIIRNIGFEVYLRVDGEGDTII